MGTWHGVVAICATAALMAAVGGARGGQTAEPEFRPVLVGVDLSSRSVRPGDPFTVTLRFRNDGKRPASRAYTAFLHFEAPDRDCKQIVIHGDHEPADTTTLWQPGEIVIDGPFTLMAPADRPEQSYHIHAGLYDQAGAGGRILDTYDPGMLRVTASARPAGEGGPEVMAPAEAATRREALAARIPSATRVSLEQPAWRFDVDRAGGAWALTDRRSGVVWTSDPTRPRFGEVVLRNGDLRAVWRIDRFDTVQKQGAKLVMTARPLVADEPSGVQMTFSVEPTADPPGIKLSYYSRPTAAWTVAEVRLLQNALTVTDSEAGRLYVPERLGIELNPATGLPGSRQWLTYDSLSMGMCGAVKQGSAILVNWRNVDTTLKAVSSWPDLPLVPGRRAQAITLSIAAPAGYCTLHPLGRGGYVEIAHAYRALARAKGWLRTWADKRKLWPSTDRFLGAANFKPFVFSRTVPSSIWNTDKKEHVDVGFTFDEIAQVAEHWRKDLQIDRASVTLAGWIHRGYDNQHPDPLPAAPECGGNEGLKRAADRIKACGYLFGLHDNYQDMYEDAPSWGVEWLNKNARGEPKMGGNWAGGQAWQVCAIKQVELAARPETNLPKIAQLFGPTNYFIDTVFAWGLVTCEDPAHPMTREDDLQWKSKLCLLAKKHFGLFGSEEGREWAVPCADYLEGIFGQQTDAAPGAVIPLLPLVYHDCVQLMTHQGNRIGPGDDRKMADHVLFAEMQLPSFGSHLYWTQPEGQGVRVVPLPPVVESVGESQLRIRYRWKVDGPVPAGAGVFVHFTSRSATRPEGIAFQNDHAPTVPTGEWKAGSIVEDGPFDVEVPAEASGPVDIRVGLILNGGRLTFEGVRSDGLRYTVGTLKVDSKGVRMTPAPPETGNLWTRGDNGWTSKLCTTDRLIKNSWEVLSPLNRITADTPMTSHEFLTPDRELQRTRYGDVTVTVAYDRPARIGQNHVPAYGFIVEGPQYIAFCADRYGGIDYGTPVLFTARSLDGKPIARSGKVRIYHGFGDKRIRLFGKTFEVEREAVVSVQ